MAAHYGHADLKDKPYFYTPLPSAFHKTIPASHAVYQTDKISGEIAGTIVARSPIHVASGLIVSWADLSRHGDIDSEIRTALVAAHFRVNNQRTIPASSLKGMFRSTVEAISYSCPEFKITHKTTTRNPHDDIVAEHLRCQIDATKGLSKNQICPACRIFGGLGSGDGKGGYLGNVVFADAVQKTGAGDIFKRMPFYSPQPSYSQAPPRKRTGYKLYFHDSGKTRPLGRKFYKIGKPQPKSAGRYEPVEVCTEGSTFEFHIQFTNLTDGELGLLLMACGHSAPKTFALKLGGGKPVSLGTFQVNVTTLTRFNLQTAWDTYEIEKALIDDLAQIDEYVQAAHDEKLLYKDGWDKLTRIWRYPPQDFCPGGADQSY